jgi:hypothetical protein
MMSFFCVKYGIIENCPKIEKKDQVDNELSEILNSTELQENGFFLIPIVTVNKSKSLSLPAVGMNYIRHLINPVMYIYENRKEDEDQFFKNYIKTNPNQQSDIIIIH